MQIFSIKDKPISVLGVPGFDKTGELVRVPDHVIDKVPTLAFHGRRVPGGRICFRTDSKSIGIKAKFKTLSVDVGMSIFASQSFAVFVGELKTSHFIGLIHPRNYEEKEFSGCCKKESVMEDVTILLPRNEIIESVYLELDDGARLEAPTPYEFPRPIVYYGSSITEGGISCNMSNSYNAIISRHLDVDYINLGFSGNAKGELEVADYINTLDMSVFVYDYDHNSPTVEHLWKTHEPFFKRIREKNPTLPIVMMSRPYAVYGEDEIARREAVRATYENAVASGDENVYFIDGDDFFKDFADRELCFIDRVHPNDLGFHKMAEKIEPVIKEILQKIK